MTTTTTREALISYAPLAAALPLFGRVVEKRNSVPVCGAVAILSSGDAIRIRGTDMDMELAATVPGLADDGFAAVPPCHELAGIAKASACDEVAIRAAVGPDEVGQQRDAADVLNFGQRRFTLQGFNVADFPSFEFGQVNARFELPADQLARCFRTVAIAVSTEETRYYLNGVFVHLMDSDAGPVLRFVATDGHRLIRTEVPAPEGLAAMPSHIVPRKAVETLCRLIAAHKPAKGEAWPTVRIDVNCTKVRFTVGAYELTTKLVDGTYPDYCRVIPTGNDTVVRVERAAFVAMIERVTKIQSERGRCVKLTFTDGITMASVHNPDRGTSSDLMDADTVALPRGTFDIGFNSVYLVELCEALAGDKPRGRKAAPADVLVIAMGDPNSPALIRNEADPRTIAVQMPMRV